MRRLSTRDPEFEPAFAALLAEARDTTARVDQAVAAIVADVRARGDAAVIEATLKFDRLALTAEQLRVSPEEMAEAASYVSSEQREALELAATRVEWFHRAQVPAGLRLTDDTGLTLGMRWTPIDAAGLYVPGGKAAYPSSVLMNAIPARVAGVERIAICVPSPDGAMNPLVAAAARRAGVTEIYRIGGAQAIAALTYGTATIAPVDRIAGPGNAYVAEAKRQVSGRVGIDAIAGPSEVVVLADSGNDPRLVAVDLLAQTEHDQAAQAILITDAADFANAVASAATEELASLPRAGIASASWQAHGAIIIVQNWDEAVRLVDQLAPEHLQLMLPDAETIFGKLRHAGAVFLGAHCPEALGDYVAGPNHVLPTGRTARFASGLSVFDFLKRTTWVQGNEAALAKLGPAAIALAEAEGLQAHARSIALRLAQSP